MNVGMSVDMSDAWREYVERVNAIAMEMFRDYIRPFCVTRGYKFIPNQEGFGIVPLDPVPLSLNVDWTEDYDHELGKILDVLEIEIPGMPGTSFGSIMPGYNSGEQLAKTSEETNNLSEPQESRKQERGATF